MPSRPLRDYVLAEALAGRRHGVLTTSEAIAVGMSPKSVRRRVAAGRWLELHPGVLTTRAVPPTWRGALLAAVVWAGRHAVVSHRAAAALWMLDGFPPGPVEISVTTGRRRSGVVVRRRSPSDEIRAQVLTGIPATPVERTLLDVAGVAPASLGIALDDALRRKLTTLDDLWGEWERVGGRGRKGTRALRRALMTRDSRTALLASRPRSEDAANPQGDSRVPGSPAVRSYAAGWRGGAA